MKKLIIVRHAKSSWADTSLTDINRPLNSRGKRDAPFMAKLIREKGISPDLILSSPAKRALLTAKVFADELIYPAKDIQLVSEIYEAFYEEIIEVLHDVKDEINTLMIFGHNPGFTDFTNFVSDSYIENIPTCGIVGLELKEESWNKVKEDSFRLLFLEYPKKYSD